MSSYIEQQNKEVKKKIIQVRNRSALAKPMPILEKSFAEKYIEYSRKLNSKMVSEEKKRKVRLRSINNEIYGKL